MSSVRDIVIGITSIVDTLDAVLGSEVVSVLLGLAKKLGIGPLVAKAIKVLEKVFNTFLDVLDKIRNALSLAPTIVGLFEMAGSLIDTAGALLLVSSSTDEPGALEDNPVVTALTQAIDTGKGFLSGLPTTGDIDGLEASVTGLNGTLVSCENKLELLSP